jgi:transcriptional regulator of acetoin/glycerol metabolism
MSKHADAILATVESSDATSALSASWRRSATIYNIDPDSTIVPDSDSRALKEGLERDDALIIAARPYLDELYTCLDETEAAVFVADRDGLLLAQRTGRTHDVWRRRAHRSLGTRFHERDFGTCAVATCIAEERPTIVDGCEHFLTRFAHLSSIGAPIFGPYGTLIGVLVCVVRTRLGTGTRDTFVSLAVSGFARRIGLELFAAAFPQSRFVLADTGSNRPGAVLAVSTDDLIVGATRSARRLLGLTDDRLHAGLATADLFGEGLVEDLAKAEAKAITQAMVRLHNNRSAVAKSLGISRSTLYRKLKEATAAQDARQPLVDRILGYNNGPDVSM